MRISDWSSDVCSSDLGRRRRRGVQRRRPDVLADAAPLGLRDARRLLRPVRPCAGPPDHSAAAPPHLGGERLLHAHPPTRLPPAVRPPPAPPAARSHRAGRVRSARYGLDGHQHHPPPLTPPPCPPPPPL